MFHKKYLSLIMLSLLLGACAGSTDPSQGGLFSYNPDAYEQRKVERENRLAAIEAQQQQEKEQTESLTDEKSSKEAKVAAQKKQLASLNSSVNELKKRLDAAKAKDSEQAQQLAILKGRMGSVESNMQQANREQDDAAREAYLEKLRKEYNELQKDMDALLLE